ncbi:MAG: hypothetical protein NXI04_13055 [Planctomycetaceae bacterium]|nr:hypothetical protein [Planctomycetaceae bacterium]
MSRGEGDVQIPAATIIQRVRRETPFDLTVLPAVRTDRQTRFGWGLLAFATPFFVVLCSCLVVAACHGEMLLAVFCGMLLCAPAALVLWAFHCLFTVTTVGIESDRVWQIERAPWKHVSREQPLHDYRLQLKRLTLRGRDRNHPGDGRLQDHWIVCLEHPDDASCVELLQTQSRPTAAAQMRVYAEQLQLPQHPVVTDYNTGRRLHAVVSSDG